MYTYRQALRGIWTVGFFDPREHFVGESDHKTPEAAAARVAYLNGRPSVELERAVVHLALAVIELRGALRELAEGRAQ